METKDLLKEFYQSMSIEVNSDELHSISEHYNAVIAQVENLYDEIIGEEEPIITFKPEVVKEDE